MERSSVRTIARSDAISESVSLDGGMRCSAVEGDGVFVFGADSVHSVLSRAVDPDAVVICGWRKASTPSVVSQPQQP